MSVRDGKTEAAGHQLILLPNGPDVGKAKAFAQPQKGFQAADRAPGRMEGSEAAELRHRPFQAELVALNALYYVLANPDIAKLALASGGDTFAFAFQHYVNYGAQEGRKADAFFDSAYYLAHNPDVAAAHLNPLTHYDAYG